MIVWLSAVSTFLITDIANSLMRVCMRLNNASKPEESFMCSLMELDRTRPSPICGT